MRRGEKAFKLFILVCHILVLDLLPSVFKYISEWKKSCCSNGVNIWYVFKVVYHRQNFYKQFIVKLVPATTTTTTTKTVYEEK